MLGRTAAPTGRRRFALRGVLLVATTLAVAGPSAPAFGASGDLDPSFGNQGHVDVPGSNLLRSFPSILPRDDGTTYLTDDKAVSRLTEQGGFDPTFGSLGRVTVPPSLGTPTGIAVDGSGRALVSLLTVDSGEGTATTALLRLQANGVPDAAFGPGGVQSVDLDASGGHEGASAVTLDAAGNYLVAGFVEPEGSDDYVPTLTRWHPDGTLDTTLGGDGSHDYPTLPGLLPRRVRVDGDAILFSGREPFAGGSAPSYVVKLTRSGALDASFGSGGLAATQPAAGSSIPTVDFVVLVDHRVRLAQATGTPPAFVGALDGFTADGAPDTTFGPGGRRTYDLTPGKGTFFTSIAARDDVLVVTGGTRLLSTPESQEGVPLVGRLSADGAPDAGFAGDGFALDPAPLIGIGFAVEVDASQRPSALIGLFTLGSAGTAQARVSRFLGPPPPTPPAPPAPPAPAPPAPAPPAAVPPAAPLARATVIRAASVLKLPSSRACVSRRRVKLTVIVPKGLRLRTLTAKVGQAKARKVKSGVSLSLKGRPKGKVKVTVTVTLSNGKRLTRTVTYRLCAKRATKTTTGKS